MRNDSTPVAPAGRGGGKRVERSPPAGLHALADRVGIARAYVTAWGDEQPVADDTLRALLAALGLAAGTDAEAGRSLAAIDEERWARALEPVVVVDHGEPSLGVPVVVAAAAGRVEWRIRSEDGGELEGAAAIGEMPVLERRGGRSRRRLDLSSARLATGYHELEIRHGETRARETLIVVPPLAFTPRHWGGIGRDWAVTLQLYSLRSARNWGIGDFTDLAALARRFAASGASALGVNPLHALFPAKPDRVSPYSPSSRSFLNPAYLDVAAVPDFAACEAAREAVDATAFQRRLAAARETEFVDYAETWALKRGILETLHRAFRDIHLRPSGTAPSERGRAFGRFRAERGRALENFAMFEALEDHFRVAGRSLAWREWPPPFRDPGSPEVAAFAREHTREIEFACYLQWEADRQLGEAARAMREAGMSLGLYRDVAVGVDPDGAEAWSDRALLVADAAVGAPPDIHNPNGQDWGLTPLNPVALRERAYAPFIAAIRANMRHAGAVRIDHVIGLMRLWWTKRGASPADGSYLAYPFDDLIRIVALESERHRCLVVGEDLGTVPEGFRAAMERRGILSYRLLMFEREDGDGDFLAPGDYPQSAAAAVSTHDLATLRGLWRGRDLEWRRRLALYPSPEHADRDVSVRAETRDRLAAALLASGGLAPADAARLGGPETSAGAEDRLAEAAHRFLARAPSRLLLVQLEDLLGEVEQMNLPGTIDEHPNWRRKLARPLEMLFEDAAIAGLMSAIDETRRAPAAGLSGQISAVHPKRRR